MLNNKKKDNNGPDAFADRPICAPAVSFRKGCGLCEVGR